MTSSTSVRLARRPVGFIDADDFTFATDEVPSPGPGQFVVRVMLISLDASMRIWMDEVPSYLPPVGLGDVMRAVAVGEVVASAHPRFTEGTLVLGMFGVQEYALSDGRDVSKIDTSLGTPSMHLGVLGTNGLTAYFGLFDHGRARAGDTVLVSAAAGSVGAIAGQLAAIAGCHAVGVAGGRAKCRYVTEELGFHAAVDYKEPGMKEAIREACPRRVDVYFDNVGGEVLVAALANLAMNARIVLCGAISQYNADTRTPGPYNYANMLVQRATMGGFIVFDHAAQYKVARTRLARWVAEGRIVAPETIAKGSVTDFRATLQRLFSGDSLGKLVLDISG
ncbi:MAG: NADP-dependent oxidoreductase [Candidatus Nanopelagicales bacterium]